ncbi:hypothetical protein G2W53_024658 [Senna tora]|uniref:Uncharacterized protein n=1 Tax=Senna tora TaxID=362788 RepID=A0A834TBY1_9FABA|nr:hypothetical protein G2W53_024658 [Senna tora]
MASVVLILSLLVRPKYRIWDSTFTADSSEISEDASSLVARCARKREISNYYGAYVEILQEPRVCVDLI